MYCFVTSHAENVNRLKINETLRGYYFTSSNEAVQIKHDSHDI